MVNTSEGREALSGKDKLLHHSQSLSTKRGNPEEFPPVVVYMLFFSPFWSAEARRQLMRLSEQCCFPAFLPGGSWGLSPGL